jgi:hypothetical protein
MTDNMQDTGLSDGAIQIYAPYEEAAIAMHITGGDEMLRVTKQGFYVRGVRVPADEQEAEAVYLAFKQWLAWANLQRQQ